MIEATETTTTTIPAEMIGTSPVSLVSYLTVVLTCVFTALFLVYIATYFPKFISLIKRSHTEREWWFHECICLRQSRLAQIYIF